MTRFTLIAITAAVVAYHAVTTAASASPITYELEGVTAKFVDNTETDVFTGTFTYDASTTTLSSVSITVSGPVDPGVFNIPGNRPLPFSYQIQFSDSSYTWIMSFEDTLNVSPDLLSTVFECTNGVDCPNGSAGSPLTNGVTGAAVVPEPASLTLLLSALVGLGAVRRKRT